MKLTHRGVLCWQGNSDFQVSAMRIVSSSSQKTGLWFQTTQLQDRSSRGKSAVPICCSTPTSESMLDGVFGIFLS